MYINQYYSVLHGEVQWWNLRTEKLLNFKTDSQNLTPPKKKAFYNGLNKNHVILQLLQISMPTIEDKTQDIDWPTTTTSK